MKKTDLFEFIFKKVSEKCEVSSEIILSGNKAQETVDARCMLVYFCKRYGLSTNDLMLFLCKKHYNGIHSIIKIYEIRHTQCYFFRQASAEIEKEIELLFGN